MLPGQLVTGLDVDVLAEALDGGAPAVLPGDLGAVRAAVNGLARYDGIRARFASRPAVRAYRDPRELVTGRLLLPLRVTR